MTGTIDRREPRRRLAVRGAWTAGLACLLMSEIAQAQTGGTTGTIATGPLTSTDFFIGVQKDPGVNLSDVDKAKFLNRASCQCKRPVGLKAILNASSAVKALALPGTDIVSMKIGLSCDQPAYTNLCPTINSMSLSEFRLNGMLTMTTVDVLAKSYGINATNITGTGGFTGSGGDTGTGGTGIFTGTGGTTGTGGVSGSGGGIGAILTTADDPCAVGDAFSQPVYVFVESTPGLLDAGGAQLNLVIDGTPPPTPTPVTVTGANEALIVDWTSVNPDNNVPDLQGYQVFCTRADQYQVFKDGTFDTSVDSCNNDGATMTTTALADIDTHYICSDFLSTSTTSTRVQILENGIFYGIAVGAVDSHGNAALGFPLPPYTQPIPTLDFYHEYRVGDPQGQATGGCSVSGRAVDGGAAGLVAIGVACGVVVAHRRRRRRRP